MHTPHLWNVAKKMFNSPKYKRWVTYILSYLSIVGTLAIGILLFLGVLHLRSKEIYSPTTVVGPGVILCATIGMLGFLLEEYEKKLLSIEEE